MNVTITGRHVDVTDGIREHIAGGLEKVSTHFKKVIDVDAILTVEKHRHIAEFNVHANGLRINAKGSSDDLYASIDSALAKVDKQVRKHKERIMSHQPRPSRNNQSYDHHVIELSAMSEGNGEDHEIIQTENHNVIHRETIDLKTMTVDEAAFQLDLVEDEFFVFCNSETTQTNVIYGRVDGTYGLIES